MRLSDQQWRVLTFLAGETKWISVLELEEVRTLNRGDSGCLDSLADLKLVELGPLRAVRLTPAGQVVATEERQT